MNIKTETVSALMAVYSGTNVTWFNEALKSLLAQTVPVDEIVVVADGPCDAGLRSEVDNHSDVPIRFLQRERNQGLGAALAFGVEQCVGTWILRMDDDDVSVADRLALQRKFLADNPNIDVCGGQIEERAADMLTVHGIRHCPMQHNDIVAAHNFRNAMNHVTVMARRDAILAAGNYRSGTIGYEDYDLWFRMMRKGHRFANIEDRLVLVRFSDQQVKSRRGMKATIFEIKMQTGFYRQGHIGVLIMMFNIVWRALPRLLPAKTLSRLMQSRMRDKD
ncbi:glycosyltransferase [Alphaproteobacteria bacterium]|nr:glycosyltransferase [Alphaproteobacteria bacterium]